MSKLDAYEREVLQAFEKGKPRSVATKSELEKLKAAAKATAIKDRRVNIRLSSTPCQPTAAALRQPLSENEAP